MIGNRYLLVVTWLIWPFCQAWISQPTFQRSQSHKTCFSPFSWTHSFAGLVFLQANNDPFDVSASNSPESSPSRFDHASSAFEAAHMEDPRPYITATGETIPYSVHYHRRMAHWLSQLDFEAPESVQLAVQCQHIRRWTRPRADYPTGLVGYKKWRSDLAVFHSQEAGRILLESGYDAEMVERVGQLLRKVNLTTDPDVQLLEDVICVVFLENEYTAFIVEQEEQKSALDDDDRLVKIVQKTLNKMTPRGHEVALQLAGQLSERGLRVVQRALEESS